MSNSGKRLNVLVLYNDRWTHIQSTREHLDAFANRSRHTYHFLPASEMVGLEDVGKLTFEDYRGRWPQAWDFSAYDAVVWHFVLPAYKSAVSWAGDYVAELVIERLAAYDGLKVLFVQDEYDSTATIWQSIRKAGIDLVMTCVPEMSIPYVYPADQVPGVEFIQTLTGFVPDEYDLDRFALPMADREVRIAYRGRQLPFRYGDLARQKYMIGVQMRAVAQSKGVKTDIDWVEDARIYGEDWYRFLGSARAMLATESGSNVFDFDGVLHAAEANDADLDYSAFHAKHLAHLEGRAVMNQVSPKIFEAIALRTALICFEGKYSGVIRPGEHFIPLKFDLSNADDVFAQLEDVASLEAMTERAYRDVIASGDWSYSAFVKEFDRIVADRVPEGPRVRFVSAPILVCRGEDVEPVVRKAPLEYALNDWVMHSAYQRRDLEADMANVREAQSTPYRNRASRPPEDAAEIFSVGPDAVRCYEFWSNAGASLATQAEGALVLTPPISWHYAAGVHLDLSGLNLKHQHAWARVTLDEVRGDVRAGLYEAESDSLHSEERAPEGDGPHVLYLPIPTAKTDLLVLRTGAEPRSAAAVVKSVSVLAASAYNPVFLKFAQELADLPPEDRPWPISDTGVERR